MINFGFFLQFFVNRAPGLLNVGVSIKQLAVWPNLDQKLGLHFIIVPKDNAAQLYKGDVLEF